MVKLKFMSSWKIRNLKRCSKFLFLILRMLERDYTCLVWSMGGMNLFGCCLVYTCQECICLKLSRGGSSQGRGGRGAVIVLLENKVELIQYHFMTILLSFPMRYSKPGFVFETQPTLLYKSSNLYHFDFLEVASF